MFEIGSSLREARLRQQLDFSEVEQAVKVRAKYLRALEEEQFETLPASTYVKGFLRAYADFLGLEGQLYVDEYNTRYIAGEDEDPQLHRRRTTTPRPRAHRRFERNVVVLALLGIAVVTSLVIAAWRFGGTEDQGGAFKGLATVPTTPRTTPAVPVETTGRAARRLRLVVSATNGSSWLDVRAGSATGRQLYRGTLELGQRQRFVARRLWLTVGFPEALTAKLNGKTISLPRGDVVVTRRGARSATTGP